LDATATRTGLLAGWTEAGFEPARPPGIRSARSKHRSSWNIGLRGIRLTHSYWGEIASGTISADMSGRMRAGFASSLAASISGSFSFRAPDFRWSAMVLHVPGKKSVPSLCFGSQMARRDFAVGRPGAGKSLTNPNSTMPQPRARRERADQIAADCRPRSRRMAPA
jgi:hypothetical protein